MNLCVFMNIRFSSGKTSLLLQWHFAPAADALLRGTCSSFYCLELLSSTDMKIQRKKLAFLETLLSTEHWGSARCASWGGTPEGRPWDVWLQGRGRAPLVNRLPAALTLHFHKPEEGVIKGPTPLSWAVASSLRGRLLTANQLSGLRSLLLQTPEGKYPNCVIKALGSR